MPKINFTKRLLLECKSFIEYPLRFDSFIIKNQKGEVKKGWQGKKKEVARGHETTKKDKIIQFLKNEKEKKEEKNKKDK
ncbi:MAG: hypothetical protein PHQ72_01745 [Hespellia sp.]|nr:hypothetical protein [Hespellia sp.]